MTDKETMQEMMPETETPKPQTDAEGISVLFKPLPNLSLPLQQHKDFLTLIGIIRAIDIEIQSAKRKKARLLRVVQTSAVHLTCLKHAKRIAVEQEALDGSNAKSWLKMVVAIAERARELMDRENVKENYSHYEKPKVLRVLVNSGNHHRVSIKKRAETFGIMARDEADIRFTLEHWHLILMELSIEPHDEIMKLQFCKNSIAWLESTLAIAVADRDASS